MKTRHLPVQENLGERDNKHKSMKFFCCLMISAVVATWMQAVMQFNNFSCKEVGEVSGSSASAKRVTQCITFTIEYDFK